MRPDPAWRVCHPCLELHSQGNWSPWVESGVRYEGPEDLAPSSRKRQGTVPGVWRGGSLGRAPCMRLARGVPERVGCRRKPGCWDLELLLERGLCGGPIYGPRTGSSVWQEELASAAWLCVTGQPSLILSLPLVPWGPFQY